ncbi:MAG: hypothetical protein RBR97_11150 [Bacteroidales bacterium]|nr:hypothetical protein [Bacteroidales bacterium]
MIDANTIEKELLRCIEILILQADYNEFANYLSKLTDLGYRVHIKVNPDKKLYNFILKQYKPDDSKLLSKKENLTQLVLTEKFAAIRAQDFEYAVKLRNFENEIEYISEEEVIRTIATTIKLKFEYSIAIHLQEIYIVIQSELHFLKFLEEELYKIRNKKYSQKIESIEEKVFENKKLNASTRELLKQNYETFDENCKVYVASVFQNRSKEIIYLQPFSNFDRKPAISLKEHLNEIDCSDIRMLTLLCTYYLELQKPLMPYIGINNPIIDVILSDSLGWLAYPHQLIALFSLATGINSKEKIVKFVEDFNSKNQREINVFLNQPLLGTTLGEIVNERIISKQGTLKYPNYNYGYKIYNYLSE